MVSDDARGVKFHEPGRLGGEPIDLVLLYSPILFSSSPCHCTEKLGRYSIQPPSGHPTSTTKPKRWLQSGSGATSIVE